VIGFWILGIILFFAGTALVAYAVVGSARALVSEKVGPLGLGGKRTNVIFNVPLANVMMAQIQETGLVRKSRELVLTFEDFGMLQNPRFKIEDPEGWVTAIQATLGRT
jgi:hypothetical protein